MYLKARYSKKYLKTWYRKKYLNTRYRKKYLKARYSKKYLKTWYRKKYLNTRYTFSSSFFFSPLKSIEYQECSSFENIAIRDTILKLYRQYVLKPKNCIVVHIEYQVIDLIPWLMGHRNDSKEEKRHYIMPAAWWVYVIRGNIHYGRKIWKESFCPCPIIYLVYLYWWRKGLKDLSILFF